MWWTLSNRADRFDALADAWRREHAEEVRRVREAREELPLSERVARGIALSDLDEVDRDGAAGGRLLLWVAPRNAALPTHLAFGQGAPVVLWMSDPTEPGAVRGVVGRRRPGRLGIIVDDELPDAMAAGGFRLDLGTPDVTFRRGAAAIEAFRTPSGEGVFRVIRAALFDGDVPSWSARPPSRWFDDALNEAQREAVGLALSGAPLTLVHGPPGTGKTRTLVEVVRQLVADGARVLVTAASNGAVDNLAERLADGVPDTLRLGHPARVAPSVEVLTLDARLSETPQAALARDWIRDAQRLLRKIRSRRQRGARRAELRDLRREVGRLFRDARQQRRGAERAIVDRAPVVCATAAGSDAWVLGDASFDVVVLDEATQASDPIALVALQRGARAVLAGDPEQLPPTVLSDEAARAGLSSTFFERAARAANTGALDVPLRMLEVQHRMSSRLQAFPSAQTYGGRLRPAAGVAERDLADLGVTDDPLRAGAVIWVDTAGRGWTEERGDDDPSTSNPEQADRVVREVERLLGRGVPADAIAVIAPYSAQVRALRDRFERELVDGLEVDSVDGFQGREKEVVVIDLVRSNDDGAIGFLADVRRMNVAITRARRLLLIVGDSATVGGHPYYAALIEHVEREETYISAWSDDAEPFEVMP